MLQTRFENEQFNSLPLIFANNRSINDYITTDRPDSSQLVDLHIYIIPKSVWKNVQHLAQNESMDDAISAGFVRVSPDMKLRKLRESIDILCGKENNFPREFIFLRSVGRCLTRVKQTQENELKVKNYRPPQTLASEIYLLEGRHEDYGNIPSASPALSSASYVFGNRRQHRFNFDDHGQELSRLSHHYDRKPLHSEKDILPIINTTYRRPPSSRKSGSRFTHISSDLDETLPNTSVVTSVTARELTKLKEEQERLRRRQAELERIRRAAEEKKLNSEREENERQRRRQEKEQLEREENERKRRRQEKEQLEYEENERQRRRLEKEQLERDEKERQRRRQEKEQLEREEKERQRRRQEKEQFEREERERRRQLRRQLKAEIERRRLEKLELAATTIQATFRGFHERQTFRERQRNSHIMSQTSIGLTSDLDSNPSRPETRTIKKEKRESNHSNSSSLLSLKTERKIRSNTSSSSSSLHLKTEDLSIKNNLDNDEDERAATVTKTRHSDEEILPVSTPDINDDDTYELKRRDTDARRQQQQSEEEKRRAKELEDQRRRQSSKHQLPQDVESLRARLEELRTERINIEKSRDEVIKQLRHVHQRITLRRRDARDMWKKKYFQEKKKTPAIEERSTLLKTDLDLIHDKIVQIIDNERKHFAQVGCSKEAETGGSLLKITRVQHEIQDIRHQLDQAKLRLTTDLKLRKQADNECQLLKHELTQAKMNLNHIKNRITV